MTEVRESSLYEAATNALASEASSDNVWTRMVTASFVYPDITLFKHELRKVERLIKSEYILKSMPASWRSAKSVCLAAMARGLKLTDENGLILGKSGIQLALKISKESLDPYHRVVGAVSILKKCLPECAEDQKRAVRVALLEISKC